MSTTTAPVPAVSAHPAVQPQELEQAISRQPLLNVAAAFSAGVLFAHYFWRPPLMWIAAAVVFVMAALYWNRRRDYAAFLCVLCAAMTGGALDYQLSEQARGSDPAPASAAKFSDGQPLVMTAHVIRDGLART